MRFCLHKTHLRFCNFLVPKMCSKVSAARCTTKGETSIVTYLFIVIHSYFLHISFVLTSFLEDRVGFYLCDWLLLLFFKLFLDSGSGDSFSICVKSNFGLIHFHLPVNMMWVRFYSLPVCRKCFSLNAIIWNILTQMRSKLNSIFIEFLRQQVL